MSIDLTGITNKNEYYTNHYFSTVFEENTSTTISNWNAAARDSEEIKTPWSLLRQNARQYYTAHDKFVRSSVNLQVLANIKALAGSYLKSLGYPEAKPEVVAVDDSLSVPVYLEMTKSNGAPLLWVLLSASKESDAGIMESFVFNADDVDDDAAGTLYKGILGEMANEDLVTKILFGTAEPPRFIMLIGMNQIALIDRNKWNEKRYLQFELEEIFSRLENTTLQAMSVLLHKDSLCPDDGKVLLDELDEQSQKNASGVSQDLKYALRESIELLGNEVLYDMKTRLGRDLDVDPVDAGQLTLECLRYMYRMLFVLFIESRPELGYAPIKAQSYYSGYSLESLRDIADNIRDDVNEVGDGYYLHETLAKLYELIYDGYPKTEDELKKATGSDSLHDMFLIAPLKAHIFDPEYTKMITAAKLRNSCMLRIIDLMSLTRATGRKNGRRGRISYANLGINQMGAVYEALLSYRGFIAEHDLYEVKRAGDSFNELDVGYFVSESELDQYTEDERVRYESGEKAGKLRMYEKGTFIYRLAGREREKSASYYTPEVLTKCLVKYALKELLEGKTADEILKLTICEPAMGSAAFLNEAINQLAEAYISRKEKETGEIISYEKRFNELQKVKMFIADRNVYGIDLNPVAVELAEVSLWLNTIYEGGFVPWLGTQLVNGNSLIGARRQVYRVENTQSTSKGLRWYEIEPDRVPLGTKRMPKKQVYHFLLGDPGMCSYSDKVIKQLEPANIKEMNCFLPTALFYAREKGVTALIHPDTPFDATNGQMIRRLLYSRLRYHFHFINELRLFPDVHHNTVFSLNVYKNQATPQFYAIFNLFAVEAIEDCFDSGCVYQLEGMKDSSGNWCIKGKPDRLITITKKDLKLFGQIFDELAKEYDARLPIIHSRQLLEILRAFEQVPSRLLDYETITCSNEMWHETNCSKNGLIRKEVHFPASAIDTIYSGSHIGNANPLFKTSRRVCTKVSDFDPIDLSIVGSDYIQRVNYTPGKDMRFYWSQVATTEWGQKYTDHYRVVARRMLDLKGAKTVMAAIIPPGSAHLTSVHGWAFADNRLLVLFAGLMASNVYDFFIKIEGKDNLYGDNTKYLPLYEDKFSNDICIRALRLNCLTSTYKDLWESVWCAEYKNANWASNDKRLSSRYDTISQQYDTAYALRSDFERRQALVEIDVLIAMSLKLSLEQLKILYRLNFAAAIQQENDTWYDANGRIIFTNNRSLTGVGFSRTEWENAGAVQPARRCNAPWDGVMKHAPAGYVFARTIMDDTMPGGPVERTIEYVAPFDRCDREQDYETAWKFFEEKYGK